MIPDTQQPLELNLDSTALGNSGCILALKRTIIDGYTEQLPGANLIYGVAVHKFIDIMYKTRGDYKVAKEEALRSFDIPKHEPSRQSKHLMDRNHMLTTCFTVWETFVKETADQYELIELMLPCWKCRGTGVEIVKWIQPNQDGTAGILERKELCPICKGAKNIFSPSSEVTFSIQYYSDPFIKINLCGTIDRLVKIQNGVFCIRDWKTTSGWDTGNYFTQYELSRQLRMYSLTLKLMANLHPDSILGKIGSQPFGCAIDAIFLKPAANEVKILSSDVIVLKDNQIYDFKSLLDSEIQKLSKAVELNNFPQEGILNGSCMKQYGRCMYFHVCKQHDPVISDLLLKRDFKQRKFDPLNYNE